MSNKAWCATRSHSSAAAVLAQKNAHMCCVCKAFGIGLQLHHIDGDHSNTVDDNLAVLCVADHDAHHRPDHYRVRHVELGTERIAKHKREWEEFVAEAARPKPRLLATISAYGTADALHSAKVAFQWTDGRIAFERVYHLHTGTIDDWTTDIAEEVVRVGRRILLVMLSEPLDVDHCPCCRRSLSNVIDRGYGLRRVAPNWQTDSVCTIYINPEHARIAVLFFLEQRQIFSGQLHLCGGTHLHFHCEDYDELVEVKRWPSVRAQASRLVRNLLRDWSPARTFIGTGDHTCPRIIEDLYLPWCWEQQRRT